MQIFFFFIFSSSYKLVGKYFSEYSINFLFMEFYRTIANRDLDIMLEVKGLSEVNENLKALELQVKKEQSGGEDDVLGDVRSGTFDD